MSLFERLSAEEKMGIEKYIENYAGEDGDNCNGVGDLDWILRFWDRNKSCFAKMFKDKLILSKDICYHESMDHIERKMDQVFNSWNCDFRNFYNEWNKMIEKECGPCTYEWDEPQEKLRMYLRCLVEAPALATNKYSYETFSLIDDNTGKKVVIPKNCKTIKAIGKIVKAKNLNLDDFERFRLEHSTILNQKTMRGRLCLSIHPLDFMTMSDNDCNWQSCMNWRDGGEYRQGTVEMMNSNFVVMAYLESVDHPFSIANNFNWSNKKWRQLFVVTPEIIMGIKPYPYYNEDCETTALAWLKELAQESGYGDYCDTIDEINNDDYSTLKDGRRVNFNFDMHHMYNDITSGHRAFVTKNELPETEIYIMLSGETECMSCGEDMTHYYDEHDPSDLLCDRCEPHYRCCCCGDRISGEDSVYWLDDQPYCSYCYDRNAVECPCCEEIHADGNMTELYLTLDDKNVAEDSPSICVCDDCARSLHPFGGMPRWVSRRSRYSWYSSEKLAVNPRDFKDEDAINYFFPCVDDYADFLAENNSEEEEQEEIIPTYFSQSVTPRGRLNNNF